MVLQQPCLYRQSKMISVPRRERDPQNCHNEGVPLAISAKRQGAPAADMSNKTNNSKLYDCLTNNAQLRRYLSGRTRCSEEAADIYQESVARVLEQSRKSTINNPIGYAIRVARNLLTARPVDCDDDIDNLDSPKANPEYLLEEAQRIELITQALENMPEQRRRAFELRRLHGESRKAIAEQLGISMETVTRHITRALADIQRYIDSKTK